MLRFVLEKLRESPGPLKQARIIASDLAEEVLDVAEHYIDRWGYPVDENGTVPYTG